MKLYDENGKWLSHTDLIDQVIVNPDGSTAAISTIGMVTKNDLYAHDCIFNPERNDEDCEYLEGEALENRYPDTLLIEAADKLSDNDGIMDRYWDVLEYVVDDWRSNSAKSDDSTD